MSAQTLTLDQLRTKRPTAKFRLYTDTDAIVAYDAALKAGATKDELEKSKAAVEQSVVVLELRALTRREYKALREAHAPSAERALEIEAQTGIKNPDVDGETFLPALIAACISNATLTPEDVRQLSEDSWPDRQTAALYVECMELCNREVVDVLGKGFVQTTS